MPLVYEMKASVQSVRWKGMGTGKKYGPRPSSTLYAAIWVLKVRLEDFHYPSFRQTKFKEMDLNELFRGHSNTNKVIYFFKFAPTK